MAESNSRIIRSDLDGNLDASKLADDETCVVLSNVMRIALLKLCGSISPRDLQAKGLSEHEAGLVSRFYHLLET